MRTLDAIGIAETLVASTDSSVIVLQIESTGSGMRVPAVLPSLSDEDWSRLPGVLFIVADTWAQGVAAFERLTRDAADEDAAGTIVTGTIALVCRPFGRDDGVETHVWDLDDADRPVFGPDERDHGPAWRREAIVSRI